MGSYCKLSQSQGGKQKYSRYDNVPGQGSNDLMMYDVLLLLFFEGDYTNVQFSGSVLLDFSSWRLLFARPRRFLTTC